MTQPDRRLCRLLESLHDPDRAAAAARALGGQSDPVVPGALCAALAAPPDERTAVAVVRALARQSHPEARLALQEALNHPSEAVRTAALDALGRSVAVEALTRIVRADPSVRLRRRALASLAQLPAEQRWPILEALADPVWRVRREAVQRLLLWQRDDNTVLDRIRERLGSLPERDPLVGGAWKYLRFLAGASGPQTPEKGPVVASPLRSADWWDDDPPVLAERLRHLDDAELLRDLHLLPKLLTLQDGRPTQVYLQEVRRFAVRALARLGQAEHLSAVLKFLDEPRQPFAAEWVRHLIERLTPERRAELGVREMPIASPLRPGRAIRQRHESEVSSGGPIGTVTAPRALGRGGLTVSPLGISGRYGLPERGFREALDAGINLYFWEPSYQLQTRTWQALPASTRSETVVIAGSFAATAREVRDDFAQALRLLRIERLGVFLLFWVRSPARLSEEVLELLADLRAEGRVRAIGLSTHLRPLALQAIRDGWDVVMVRHSLAHRGAEAELLPEAQRQGTGVVTFSNLCYGRLLRATVPGAEARYLSAADCYRYALNQPGVSACLSAPRNTEQLRENLRLLPPVPLSAEEWQRFRAVGDVVYAQHRAFMEGIR